MIHLGKQVVRKWLGTLLHIHDSPQRTAAAYAVGIFFGFSPFLGFHTVFALIVAFMLGLNRVAVLLGVYSNLPWIIAPYYTIVTMTAARVMGVPTPPGFGTHVSHLFSRSFFDPAFWKRLGELVHPLLWPYSVGSMTGAIVLGACSYWIALAVVVEGRKHIHLHGHAPTHKDQG